MVVKAEFLFELEVNHVYIQNDNSLRSSFTVPWPNEMEKIKNNASLI